MVFNLFTYGEGREVGGREMAEEGGEGQLDHLPHWFFNQENSAINFFSYPIKVDVTVV